MLLLSHFFKDVQHFEKEKLSEIKHSLQNEQFFRKTKKHCSLTMDHPDSPRPQDPSKVFKIWKICVPKMEHKNQNLVPYFAGNNPHICTSTKKVWIDSVPLPIFTELLVDTVFSPKSCFFRNFYLSSKPKKHWRDPGKWPRTVQKSLGALETGK